MSKVNKFFEISGLIISVIFIICFISSVVIAGVGLYKLYIRDSIGNIVSSISDDGTSCFEDSCAYGGTCSITSGTCWNRTNCDDPPYPSTIIWNMTTNDIVGWFNNNGSFCAEGNITQSSSMSVCAESSYRILDSSGTLEACMDSAGNFYSRNTINCNVGVC